MICRLSHHARQPPRCSSPEYKSSVFSRTITTSTPSKCDFNPRQILHRSQVGNKSRLFRSATLTLRRPTRDSRRHRAPSAPRDSAGRIPIAACVSTSAPIVFLSVFSARAARISHSIFTPRSVQHALRRGRHLRSNSFARQQCNRMFHRASILREVAQLVEVRRFLRFWSRPLSDRCYLLSARAGKLYLIRQPDFAPLHLCYTYNVTILVEDSASGGHKNYD